MKSRSNRPRRGMFAVDVTIGLAVVATLAVTMFVLLAREQGLARRMAAARAATRAAEATLADLQAGRAPRRPTTPPASLDPTTPVVFVRRAEGGVVSGHAWVAVRATVAGRAVELLGLVPDGPGLRQGEGGGDSGTTGETGTTRPTTGEAR